MVSKASEDLPEPDRPVITIRLSRGSLTSMPFRLCSRAPRTMISRLRLGLSVILGPVACRAGEEGGRRPTDKPPPCRLQVNSPPHEYVNVTRTDGIRSRRHRPAC